MSSEEFEEFSRPESRSKQDEIQKILDEVQEMRKQAKLKEAKECSSASSTSLHSNPLTSEERGRPTKASCHRKFQGKRSQSLLITRDKSKSSGKYTTTNPSTPNTFTVCKAQHKSPEIERSADPSQESFESSNTSSDEESDDAKTYPLICRNPVRKKTSSTQEQNNKQVLLTSLHRLNAILIDIHANSLTSSCSRSATTNKCEQLKCLTSQNSLPSSEDKVSLERLSALIDSLSEQLKTEVSNFIKTSAQDKIRLEQVQNDNSILRQRLNTSLNMQKNMEGELKQLSRENKLLEAENKDLAIKIVPFLPTNNNSPRMKRGDISRVPPHPQSYGGMRNSIQQQQLPPPQRITDTEVFYENRGFTGSRNSNNDNNNNGECCSEAGACDSSENILEYKDQRQTVVRHDSNRFNNNYVKIEEDEDDEDASQSMQSSSNAGVLVGVEEMKTSHQLELDKISTYVKWKAQDFGRLHGKLSKNFEEMHRLKQMITIMSEEKEEILSDLDVLASSCKELTRERDNYESILKMILKEKNSPDSNLCELLDGLLNHLGKCTDPQNNPSTHSHSSKCFLESALHAMQEQNLTVREEMSKVKELMQRTAGQNSFLQSSNEMLTVKVLNLQKQLEARDEEVKQFEAQKTEKYQKLEQLYKDVLKEKDTLDIRLLEKDKELGELKTLIESKDRALSEEMKKFEELEKENDRLEKQVARDKLNIEKMSQMILHLKASLREQKGKWHERIRIQSNDLKNTKDHCKWLQTQIENLNNQLVDAHERIKMHEKDKAVLAQRVLTSEEERKMLDRKILEIKSIMEGDMVYREALAERNETLQTEINRLRKQKLLLSAGNNAAAGEETSITEKINEYLKRCAKADKKKKDVDADNPNEDPDEQSTNTLDELASISIASAPVVDNAQETDNTPPPLLTRKSRINQQGMLSPLRRKHFNDAPRAAVSLHNPSVVCYTAAKR